MMTEKDIIELRNDFEKMRNDPKCAKDREKIELVIITIHAILELDHKANIALKIMEIPEIWCGACFRFHDRPKDKLHHAELRCKGEYIEKS